MTLDYIGISHSHLTVNPFVSNRNYRHLLEPSGFCSVYNLSFLPVLNNYHTQSFHFHVIRTSPSSLRNREKRSRFTVFQRSTRREGILELQRTVTPRKIPWLVALDEMGTRIDDLERNIADLMTQAGPEEVDKWTEQECLYSYFPRRQGTREVWTD